MVERQCEGYRKKLTMNGQEREVRVLKATLSRCRIMMLLTMHEWVAAKASMCDLLRFGVACCVLSISGDSLGVPITD